MAARPADDVVAVEIAGDVTHRPMRMEMPAVEARDPGGFLAAVLKRVKAERNEARRIVGAPDAEHAAFLAELVIIERIGRQHRLPARLLSWNRHIGRGRARVAPRLNKA